MLLAETERRRGILRRLSACFVDHREPAWVEHEVGTLVSQRVLGLALGYEDLVDHEELRADALLASLIGVSDPSGDRRRRDRDQGKPLAGKSTLNRFEWGAVSDAAADRYKRIAVGAPGRCLRAVYLNANVAAVYGFDDVVLANWSAFDAAMAQILDRIGSF